MTAVRQLTTQNMFPYALRLIHASISTSLSFLNRFLHRKAGVFIITTTVIITVHGVGMVFFVQSLVWSSQILFMSVRRHRIEHCADIFRAGFCVT